MSELAPTLMIQGTASDVGKTTIVAALCRALARRGIRALPFKAQNLSRNAAITPEGGEIGTGQMLQALAARVPAHVDMNPLLLKPEPGMMSQVVVLGRAEGRRRYSEYGADAARYREIAHGALGRLRRSADIVLIEGAGSPAEINLRRTDIANMDVALRARSPVLLVGDISRGGVYAQLAGTLALLAEEERELVRGLLINKLIGDPAQLVRGNDELTRRFGVPVCGVLPMLPTLALPDEDSLALTERDATPRAGMNEVEIAIVRYPAISNHDEFRALEQEPGVQVRYVVEPRELLGADLVILPGSKSTRTDLAWCRLHGFDAAIERYLRQRGPLLAICGGAQILGASIEDPNGIEGARGTSEGLGVLSHRTRFEGEKRTSRVRVELDSALLGHGSAEGYEIHAGHWISDGTALATPLRLVERDGLAVDERGGAETGRVVATMVHGLLESPRVRAQLLAQLRPQNAAAPRVAAAPTIDQALDRVADALEDAVDVDALLALARRGVVPRSG